MFSGIPIRSALKTCLLTLGFLVASACKSGGGADVSYSNNYKGSYTTDDAAFTMAQGQSVAFQLSWNETNGIVSGLYQDDHFAPTGAKLSGSIANGVHSFTISLASAIDGVQTLDFSITTVDGTLEASVQGKAANGSVVFAAANIALEAVSNGAGGNTKPADVAAFFAQVAGTYNWKAKLTGKSIVQLSFCKLLDLSTHS